MLINWYPGHMHKARKKVKEIMPSVDMVIEILDARLPYSSTNPMIERLRGDKPYLKVLSKSDLADPVATERWLRFLRKQQGVDALAITIKNTSITHTIPSRIVKLFPNKDTKKKAIKSLILGVPNVGKSTLINMLAGRKVAKVGNEPAITKGQQKIKVSTDLTLIDTPGMTWPGSKNETINYRLATSGAIRDTAMEYDDVALFAMEYMLEYYPGQISTAYQLDLTRESPHLVSPLDALEHIGRKRGCMQRGGVDFQRAGELFIRELRDGKLGRISLEHPEMIGSHDDSHVD